MKKVTGNKYNFEYVLRARYNLLNHPGIDGEKLEASENIATITPSTSRLRNLKWESGSFSVCVSLEPSSRSSANIIEELFGFIPISTSAPMDHSQYTCLTFFLP